MRILLLCTLVAAVCASDWNYDPTSSHGPNHWPDECVLASSTSQSPIDIDTGNVVSQSFPSFSFSGYGNVDVKIKNNGHSVKMELQSYENALLTGGGLSGTYKLAQFHLHWGSADNQGSEHKLKGNQYAMEVHFVHYNAKYTSLGNAADKSDGLAVLAWLFKVDDSNDDWDDIFQHLPIAEGNTAYENGLDLHNLMGNVGTFYRYDGSLTTPPCYESVTWTVFKDKLEVDNDQIEIMRSVVNSHGHHIEDNFRPTQALNGRTVYKG